MKKEKISGEMLFERYYSDLFQERWISLKESFSSEPAYCSIDSLLSEEKYYIDAASVLCAGCLPLEQAESVLDMCAAPGGKTLVISRRMSPSAKLLANERSKDRYCRLSKVIKSFLPAELCDRISFSCADGAVLCRKLDNREYFDSILLDAPCSSERHVYNDKKYLDQWTPNRVKSLSMAQWSLLSSAFLMLKNGGHILYSTCALAKDENDGVVKRLLKKYSNASVLEIDIEERKRELSASMPGLIKLPDTERTEYGYQVLPDLAGGAGPIYFCLIKKM